jgi:cytochrome c peroxidase
MDHEQAELHTPPLNKIGLPEGYLEHGLHQSFEDLARIYGREQATRIWREIPEEHCRESLS